MNESQYRSFIAFNRASDSTIQLVQDLCSSYELSTRRVTYVHIHRDVHIRLFMTMRDVWLPYSSFSAASTVTLLSSSRRRRLVIHWFLIRYYFAIAKLCMTFVIMLHTITPVGRCFHPPNGAIGLLKRCKGPFEGTCCS